MQDRTARKTLTIPEAAKALGIGRNAGYEAARRGEIPTIRIGRRLLVPLIAFERMLQVDAKMAPRLACPQSRIADG